MVKKFLLVLFAPILFLALTAADVYAITFMLSNPNSDGDQVTFDVSISGLTSSSCPNTKCYLQAAFTKTGANSNYFGFTKNQNGEWYKYNGKPEASYIQSTFFSFIPTDGNWSGQLTIKVDGDDSGYDGPGNYDIKAWRYSGNSSNGSSGESDGILTTNLTHPVSTPTPTPTEEPSSNPTPTPSPTPKPTPTSTPTPKTSPKPTATPSINASASASPQVLGSQDRSLFASDAGLLDSSTDPQNGFQNAPGKMVAGILVISGTALVLFSLGFHFWYRKINKGKIHETKDPFQL